MDTSTVVAGVDTLGRRIARRRHRTVQEKIQIVTETRLPGASVAEVARRHSMNANQLFAWRRLHDHGLLGEHTRRSSEPVKLLAVRVGDEPGERTAGAASPPQGEGRIEIHVGESVRIVLHGAVPTERLEQVLAVLRR